MNKRTMRKRLEFAAAAVLVTFFAGCAGGGKELRPEAVEEPPAVAAGASVMRLEDGREGFVIRETTEMDSASRKNFERAVALMEARDYDGAIERLEEVVTSSPGVAAPYINLAMAYARKDRLEPAERHLKTALALVPEHPAASNEYGLLLRKSGRFAEARDVYESSLARFPEYLPARRNLGILCDLYLNDQACALEQYEVYSKGNPEDEQVKVWIADLRMRLGGGG